MAQTGTGISLLGSGMGETLGMSSPRCLKSRLPTSSIGNATEMQNLTRPHPRVPTPWAVVVERPMVQMVQTVAPKAGVGVSLGRAPRAGLAGRLVGSKAEPGPPPPALAAPALPTRH